MRISIIVATIALAVGAAWPASGAASITVGNALGASSFGDAACSADPLTTCTFVQPTAATGDSSYRSPITGTIVRWSIQTGPGSTAGRTIKLRVLRSDDGTNFSAAGTGPAQSLPTTSTTETFPMTLSIQAQDYIGLDHNAPNFRGYGGNSTGALVQFFTPALSDGQAPVGPTLTYSPSSSLLINADIAAPPTSSVSVEPPCPANSRQVSATVTADPDPAAAPRALHYRLDGGVEQTAATSGSPGQVKLVLPAGAKTLEYWGEDTLGQQQAPHQTVAVCPAAADPILSEARLSPKTFRAAGRGASLSRGRRAPIGTTISYRDSQAADTNFAVLKPVVGHRKRGKCVGGRPSKGQKRCTRQVTVGSFKHRDNAGIVSVHFTGRVRNRKLAPGRYNLSMTPKANGNTGGTVRLSLRIVS